jgi:DNA repair exonuclease SbcCD nuclease subunit
MSLDIVQAEGLLLIADPHLADTPPGQRLEGYLDQIMIKLQASFDFAVEQNLAVVILGDLFHWPRDNSNKMLVDLIRVFGSRTGNEKIWSLVGNHDKYQSRFTGDVSMAVLDAAGVLNVMKEDGAQFILETGQGKVVIGASPDGTPLPKGYDEDHGQQTVIWLTHHNIQFPEFIDRAYTIKELPGIDWIINGHIHRPQPTIKKGKTTWANPGNITRLTFTQRTMDREPAAAIWRPGYTELDKFVVPFESFEKVFPDQDFPPEIEGGATEGESDYVKGLERLAWQRTQEGMGLKQFLSDNVTKSTPEGSLIWELYEEVIDNE